MKFVRVHAGDDGESHVDITGEAGLTYVERNQTRTAIEAVTGVQFAMRKVGSFSNFHNAPRRQSMIYLRATAEIGLVDGSTHTMEPGDVLQAENTTGRGHSSRVIKGGMCVNLQIEP